MTIVEMLGQSVVLTLLGMGVVYAFLIIMVFVISQFKKFIKTPGNEGKAGFIGTAPAKTDNDANVTAVISAAVNEYRKTN